MLSIVKSMSLSRIRWISCGGTGRCRSRFATALMLYGLPDISIRESKERVKTAIKNSGFNLFSRKIVINLAPAAKRKEGSIFDLPIAVGILSANEYIHYPVHDMVFIGELSLDGKVNKVNGILPMCIELEKLGIKKVVLPKENAKEASVVKKIEIIPVESLEETVEYLNHNINISFKNEYDIFKKTEVKNNLDFSEVKGQKNIKRAVEVAASGGHNILMIGSPRLWKNNDCKKNSNNSARFKFRRMYGNN